MTTLQIAPALTDEGYRFDDAGNVIRTYYVDFRDAEARTPIGSLVRVCKARRAIETCRTIQISRPECYRKEGETLLYDLQEASPSRTTVLEEVTDDPEDMAEARLRDAEANRAAELIGASIRRRTNTITRRRSETSKITSGKHCWIFCTAVEPTSSGEVEALLASVSRECDHLSYIRHRRSFALELGRMVSAQRGPQGGTVTLDSKHGDHHVTSLPRSQTVFHGPVIYVPDPYELVDQVRKRENRPGFDGLLLALFVKRPQYAPQREYRFVIWTEEEPDEKRVSFEASPTLLAAMQGDFDLPLGVHVSSALSRGPVADGATDVGQGRP